MEKLLQINYVQWLQKLRVISQKRKKSDKTTCNFMYGHGAKNSFKNSINGLIIGACLRVNEAKIKCKYIARFTKKGEN